MKVKKFSPCKINLMLAITGVRPDGFHELISLVTPTKFGDELIVETSDATEDSLTCNMEGVPCDSSNLVMKAAELYREACGNFTHFKFELIKKVPAGAGLGGGSSNGAVALLAINELCGNALNMAELEKLAAKMGSDCPLFLTNSPVVMRGRGEKVFPLFSGARKCIERLKLLIFKPDFSINTGWAYGQMKANPEVYLSRDYAENKLSEWLETPTIEGLPLINNMQIEAFKKYPALEAILADIRSEFGTPCMMSGSGSACFVVTNSLEDDDITKLESFIKSKLGDSCVVFANA